MTQVLLDKPYLSRHEAAQVAGVSVLSIDRAIKRGDLRCGHIGKRILITPQALDDFIFSPPHQNLWVNSGSGKAPSR